MQVYQLSIGAACGLSWPSDRIIIQVLDDSTNPTIKVCMLLEFGLNSTKWTLYINYVHQSYLVSEWIDCGNCESGAGANGMQQMGEQRGEHKVRGEGQQRRVQSRGSERRHETELREAM